MSTDQGSLDRPDKLLEKIAPGLSSAVLAETDRKAESINTVRFAFNPWQSIPNVELKGFLFGIQHVVLRRMELIPLVTWQTPEIQPRTGGMAFASITPGGAFPSGSVGSLVTQRLQYPSESAKNLMEVYGPGSLNDIGMTILRSLACEDDTLKVQAVLLFRAVMETPVGTDGLRGADMILEHLPRFLAGDARLLLRTATKEGVPFQGRTIPLPAQRNIQRGERMIEDIAAAVARATRAALDENSGILPRTKRDLIAASKGLKDVKAIPDRLDTWLLKQFPSFSLDSEVERATEANRELTNAVQRSTERGGDTLQALLEMQQQTFLELKKANEINAKANELNQQLLAKSAT